MHRKSHSTIAFALLLSLFSSASFASGTHDDSAIGEPANASQAVRTIEVQMTDDMRFSPSNIAVKQGETIRFAVRNAGKIKHEIVFGTPQELKEHYEMMIKMPGMEHGDEPNKATVVPGRTAEIIWRFSKTGKVDFACLQPGHYDADMKGLVTVVAADKVAADGHSTHTH